MNQIKLTTKSRHPYILNDNMYGVLAYRIEFLGGLGLLHEQTENEQDDGEHDAYGQAGAPNGAVMAVLAGGGDYVWYKGYSQLDVYYHDIHEALKMDKPPITNPYFTSQYK